METRAIVCPPNETPVVISIDSADLTKLQELVGGCIEAISKWHLPESLRGFTVYVKDEREGLAWNPLLNVHGTAIITHTGEDGEDDGLTPEQVE